MSSCILSLTVSFWLFEMPHLLYAKFSELRSLFLGSLFHSFDLFVSLPTSLRFNYCHFIWWHIYWDKCSLFISFFFFQNCLECSSLLINLNNSIRIFTWITLNLWFNWEKLTSYYTSSCMRSFMSPSGFFLVRFILLFFILFVGIVNMWIF